MNYLLSGRLSRALKSLRPKRKWFSKPFHFQFSEFCGFPSVLISVILLQLMQINSYISNFYYVCTLLYWRTASSSLRRRVTGIFGWQWLTHTLAHTLSWRRQRIQDLVTLCLMDTPLLKTMCTTSEEAKKKVAESQSTLNAPHWRILPPA